MGEGATMQKRKCLMARQCEKGLPADSGSERNERKGLLDDGREPLE
jgi:hypothetical protein